MISLILLLVPSVQKAAIRIYKFSHFPPHLLSKQIAQIIGRLVKNIDIPLEKKSYINLFTLPIFLSNNLLFKNDMNLKL